MRREEDCLCISAQSGRAEVLCVSGAAGGSLAGRSAGGFGVPGDCAGGWRVSEEGHGGEWDAVIAHRSDGSPIRERRGVGRGSSLPDGIGGGARCVCCTPTILVFAGGGRVAATG